MVKNKHDKQSRALFAHNLERQINRIGKTKAEIARLVGVKPSTISDWLAGRGFPRLETLNALADVLGVTQSELVEGVNFDKETISEEEQKVLDLFHQVPEEKRELVLSMIRAAVDNL